MKNIFTALLFVSKLSLAVCQDSLIRKNEINYSSDFERSVFYNFFHQNDLDQFAKLFLTATPSIEENQAKAIEEKISGIVQSIQKEGIESKKSNKKMKVIYDKIHDPLLKKYELENRFYEMFSSGSYNCVTATALYAIIFDKLKIPYEIKEKPTHVYLLAYPNQENILIETTSPLFGYISFNDEFKYQFISNLKKQKIIGSGESEKTTDELFNQYYFKNENITLRELVGIHYMNDALFKRDHGKWKEGYYQLEKAFLFYPSQRCRYLLMAFGVEIITKEKLQPKEKSEFIGKLSRFQEEGITIDMIKGEFSNLTQDLLFRENNKMLYKECYEIISNKITDKELSKDIAYIFNYENGRAYYNLGNFHRAKPFFKKAFLLQPNNLDLGGIFIGVISQTLRAIENEPSVLDSLNLYKKEYPSLAQFNSFNSMLANSLIVQYGDSFDKGNVKSAEEHKKSFDGLLQENPSINLNPYSIGKAFSSACSYYFKKGQKNKAREILNEGLKISPDNYQLRTRLQMIH